MDKRKVKGHKPEYKTNFRRKNKSDADRFFEKMIEKHTLNFYVREQLIDNQIDKMMYGN